MLFLGDPIVSGKLTPVTFDDREISVVKFFSGNSHEHFLQGNPQVIWDF